MMVLNFHDLTTLHHALETAIKEYEKISDLISTENPAQKTVKEWINDSIELESKIITEMAKMM